jgi:hypothetical protein
MRLPPLIMLKTPAARLRPHLTTLNRTHPPSVARRIRLHQRGPKLQPTPVVQVAHPPTRIRPHTPLNLTHATPQSPREPRPSNRRTPTPPPPIVNRTPSPPHHLSRTPTHRAHQHRPLIHTEEGNGATGFSRGVSRHMADRRYVFLPQPALGETRTSCYPWHRYKYSASATRCTEWVRGARHHHQARHTRRGITSPPTRGAFTTSGHQRGHLGITPAYTGSTHNQRPPTWTPGNHPRVRGEHGRVSRRDVWGPESPPRTRGAPSWCPTVGTGTWNHPRVRGEHPQNPTMWTPWKESPPRTRGARGVPTRPAPVERNHPRVRGEHARQGWLEGF